MTQVAISLSLADVSSPAVREKVWKQPGGMLWVYSLAVPFSRAIKLLVSIKLLFLLPLMLKPVCFPSENKCLIDDVCYNDGDERPGVSCMQCQVGSSTTEFTVVGECYNIINIFNI